VIKRDVGTLTLHKGTIGFLPPILDKVAKAVFVGEGEFNLVPATQIERNHLKLETDSETLTEGFGKAVFYFSDSTYQEIKGKAQPGGTEAGLADALNDFNKRVRYASESFENVDAEMLVDLYNPRRAGAFNAYINGQKHHDLRFHMRPWGVFKDLLTSPEEVALLNEDVNDTGTGIWYLAHRENEYKDGTASSLENKHIIHTEHYKIETVIDKGSNLTAICELKFKALMDGDRVLRFGLLPRLRVSRVVFGEDAETSFIQEDRKKDGTFYVILPEPTVAGKEYKITMEYRGNQVVEDAGGGNFFIGAREAWFPSSGAFDDHATYDLTFKVPRQYTLVSVGKQTKDTRDGDFEETEWVSDVPLVVAGFNYGVFKKKELVDEVTKYQIEGYATSDVPAFLKQFDNGMISGASITPTSMMNNAMTEAQNSMRVFTHYFGELPYGRIAITQQPQPFFGQSWPTLVYLPITAFMDSTTRWMLLQRNAFRFNEFIQEVTPHEVSHQWWGHDVCWASYHDQWLSEGFADFSAGLYLQVTEQKPDKYMQYWQRQRDRVLEKNQFGISPNDTGPIWMGIRLITHKTQRAYQNSIYPKGGYILHMLRAIMVDPKTGDQPFIDMMKDFVKTYSNDNASTESFKAIVEKHMTPQMDLDGNHKMDWFFNQWVYGTEVPHYKFTYTLTPTPDGKSMLEASITQSGVSDKFKMLVPVYYEAGGHVSRLGMASVMGNTTVPIKLKLSQAPNKVMINYYHDILAYESK